MRLLEPLAQLFSRDDTIVDQNVGEHGRQAELTR
jgi:hypothetical protein